MADKLDEGSELAVDVRLDIGGIRGFKIVTSNRRSIPDHQWWIEMLWRHLHAFEREQSDYILDLIDQTEEASRKAGEI